MACLAPHSTPSYFSSFAMDAVPAVPPPLRPRRRFFPPIQHLAPPPPSLYICHYIPSKDLFSLFLRRRNQKPPWRSLPVMSIDRGSSASTVEGLCKIVWIVEAELKNDQLLYVTGDINDLGSWSPEMAILMERTGEANIWKAEAEVAFGINLKYNYFIKRDSWDIVWRPGPQFSLSVSLPLAENGEVLVRDLWMRFSTKLPANRLWSLWMDDLYYPAQSLASISASDALLSVIWPDRNSRTSLAKVNGFLVKDFSLPNIEDIAFGASKTMYDRVYPEKDQPIEEPWLIIYTPSDPSTEGVVDSHVSKSEGTEEYDSIELDVDSDQQIKQIHQDPVSTVILMNSSICTMQRIGVMEDGKLVELLLEPVKTDVQSDSVYLGVVMKHVPHMGGAFVDIGISRPSLMDIKNNREPFIFPPFSCSTKDKTENSETESTLHSDQVANDNAMNGFHSNHSQLHHDDDDDHDIEDEYDTPEALKGNANGNISDHVDSEYSGYTDVLNEHLEVNSVNALSSAELIGPERSKSDFQDTTPIHSNASSINKWSQVQKGTKIIVQVVKEGLGTKGPTLTAYPKLRSRFWILHTRFDRIGVSKKISGIERTRLKVIGKTLQPKGFGLTVRTVAAGHSLEELQKDLEGLLSTWKAIGEHAKSAALAADEGVAGAIPVVLHKAMGQTLSVVQDYFNDKVERLIVDSPRTYHEVTNYLQDIAPDLCNRVELYEKRVPLFDEFQIEEEMNNILSKRVPLANGGSLVIEQTEALVSIDVNGGHGMLGNGTSQENAILEVNLAAAKQIARELRLRDIGGIIVIDFIDMVDDANKRLVYEEVKKAVERDRSMVKVSELSRHGLMEITRKRVRPSVTFMISEPCVCCHSTGRVEALETSFAKIEQEICRQLALKKQTGDLPNPKSWPKFMLMVDRFMCNYLTSGKRTKLAILSSSLKVWILLKVDRSFTRGAFELKSLCESEKANSKPRQVPIPTILRPTDGRPRNPNRKVTLIPVKKWKGVKK